MPTKLKLPNEIRIGYKDYQLEKVSCFHGTGQMGQHSVVDGHIQYRDTGDSVELVNTILHESLHGMYSVSGLTEMGVDKEKEECVVNALANSLTAYIRDNKQLVRWMLENV